MTELLEHRVKRLTMRSMRRGIKEMDLILSAYANRSLAAMDDQTLSLYDALLSENDQEIFAWILGKEPTPERYVDMIEDITALTREGLA